MLSGAICVQVTRNAADKWKCSSRRSCTKGESEPLTWPAEGRWGLWQPDSSGKACLLAFSHGHEDAGQPACYQQTPGLQRRIPAADLGPEKGAGRSAPKVLPESGSTTPGFQGTEAYW